MSDVYAHDAVKFYKEGMEQLDRRVLGENDAKLGLLTAYVTGLNVALIGEPGGGKTTLSSDVHHLIEDIPDENVARIPHHSDLTPQQLIGSSVTTSRETLASDGGTKTETLTAKVKPIIHEGTQVIWIDELNRVNPFAVNGVLGALENGKITTDAGEVQLKGLELAISTMNPTETRQATFPIAAATASRHAIGVIMGTEKVNPTARNDMIESLLGGWQPRKARSVITTAGLHALRQKAAELAIPGSARLLAKDLIANAVDALGQNHIHEADARITKHIATVARGIALLNGEERVQDNDLRQATKFVMTARLGIMGVRQSPAGLQQAVDDIVRSVINK